MDRLSRDLIDRDPFIYVSFRLTFQEQKFFLFLTNNVELVQLLYPKPVMISIAVTNPCLHARHMVILTKQSILYKLSPTFSRKHVRPSSKYNIKININIAFPALHKHQLKRSKMCHFALLLGWQMSFVLL